MTSASDPHIDGKVAHLMCKKGDIGDIVLFCEPGTGRYVVHRVWDIKNGMVLTWGDNCDSPDAWMTVNDIWGKVILIERGKHKITPDAQKGLLFARFWHITGRAYRKIRGFVSRVYHRIFTCNHLI